MWRPKNLRPPSRTRSRPCTLRRPYRLAVLLRWLGLFRSEPGWKTPSAIISCKYLIWSAGRIPETLFLTIDAVIALETSRTNAGASFDVTVSNDTHSTAPGMEHLRRKQKPQPYPKALRRLPVAPQSQHAATARHPARDHVTCLVGATGCGRLPWAWVLGSPTLLQDDRGSNTRCRQQAIPVRCGVRDGPSCRLR